MEIIGNQVILRRISERDKDLLLDLSQDSAATKITAGYASPKSYMHPIQPAICPASLRIRKTRGLAGE